MGLVPQKKLVEHANSPASDGSEIDRCDVTIAEQKITFLACFQGGVASLGGFIFGYIRHV
ncbi:hypothetical protein E4U43_003389 [Claviceps pusilla]|uniref:Uncharacterized protein n=1 Tax=Claviceps pusilla TaxID=123648 RepID=A0A9P7N4S6_9HYPO|nr:hypothetical protein E4U43_003389 [Claviceps pusilla]